MVGKALAALVIVLVFGYPLRTGLVVAAGLAQIGEFSFILAELGLLARPPAAGAAQQPHPGRGDHLDHAQPTALPRRRPDGGPLGAGDAAGGGAAVVLDGERRAEELPAHAG